MPAATPPDYDLTDRPLLFLDLDGVLNVPRIPPHSRLPWRELRLDLRTARSAPRDELPIRWRTDIVDGLNAMHRDGLVDVRWTTSWGEAAASHFAPAVGLDEFTVMPGAEEEAWSADRTISWKRWIVRNAPKDQGVLWIDDGASTWGSPLGTYEDAGITDLLIVPRTRQGLTATHLASIERFAKRPREERARRLSPAYAKARAAYERGY